MLTYELGETVLKLALALLAGGLVGLEREQRDRPAGLRTHILVCVGSALFTFISIEMAGERFEPTRIAAQILTGIGFLGAGTIFRSGTAVRGLTTAAGIWVVAGVGMGIAVGGLSLILALVTALLVYGVNKWIRLVEDRLFRVDNDLVLLLHNAEALGGVLRGLSQRGIRVERVEWPAPDEVAEQVLVRLRVRGHPPGDQAALTTWLCALPDVRGVEWQ